MSTIRREGLGCPTLRKESFTLHLFWPRLNDCVVEDFILGLTDNLQMAFVEMGPSLGPTM